MSPQRPPSFRTPQNTTMKLKLLKPHRHDGIDCLPGQTLTLPEDQAPLAAWLVENKVAEPLPAEAPAPVPEPAQG